MAKKVVLAGACRTAIGKMGGQLSTVKAADLGSIVIKEALKRTGVPADQVDEVLMGCVIQAGQGQNVARQASIGAGLPVEVPAVTINVVCGSGLNCVNMAAEKITMIKDALWDAFNDYHMIKTADNVAEQWGLTREELDVFAANSQNKACAAMEAGKFKDEIVPVEVKMKKQTVIVDTDEGPRPGTTPEGLAKLRTINAGGVTTAGNASGINDGAACVVVMSEEKAKELGVTPMATWVAGALGGVDPSIMGVGPVAATKKVLARTGLTIDQFDLYEANEAFAAQSVAVGKDLGFDLSKLNVNGGAIALGHPVGASGCRILVTLLHEMVKRDAKRGLATLCIGGGMGCATIVERDMSKRKVVLAGACRTAIGTMGGQLSSIPAPDLGALAIKEALKRAGVKPEQVDEVYMGNVIQAGLGQNPARQAAINAGIPVEVPAITINVLCGSGLHCVNLAAKLIENGNADIVVAGGMESMSRAPDQRRPYRRFRRLSHGYHS